MASVSPPVFETDTEETHFTQSQQPVLQDYVEVGVMPEFNNS